MRDTASAGSTRRTRRRSCFGSGDEVGAVCFGRRRRQGKPLKTHGVPLATLRSRSPAKAVGRGVAATRRLRPTSWRAPRCGAVLATATAVCRRTGQEGMVTAETRKPPGVGTVLEEQTNPTSVTPGDPEAVEVEIRNAEVVRNGRVFPAKAGRSSTKVSAALRRRRGRAGSTITSNAAGAGNPTRGACERATHLRRCRQ